MKYRILITLTVSSVIFWIIIIAAYIYAYDDRKKNPFDRSGLKSNRYSSLCIIFNLISGFVIFEIISFLIALICKSIIINVILHILNWWISMWTAHRIMPHIVNRIIKIFVDPDE